MKSCIYNYYSKGKGLKILREDISVLALVFGGACEFFTNKVYLN